MRGSLEDLDELILKCRNKRAQNYIQEAVASYRATAYRSSIVAAWVAVCYDLIEKLKELSLAGDGKAKEKYGEIEYIHRTGDTRKALDFERSILKFATEELEIISPIELIDLQRLQEDRNRCAHPSLNADGEEYSPPAELARVHIYSAVNHLLMHEPAQGKFALEKIHHEISSEYFPTKFDEIYSFLTTGPIKRARPSLIRNLTVVLVKDLFKTSGRGAGAIKLKNSIAVLSKLHQVHCESAIEDHLTRILENLTTENLLSGIRCLQQLDAWRFVDDRQKMRLEHFVERLPSQYFEEIELCLDFPPLKEKALARIKKASLNEIDNNTFWFSVPEPVMDRLIEMYTDADVFTDLSRVSKVICRHIGDMKKHQVLRIVSEAKNIEVIYKSAELESVIEAMRSAKFFETSAFDDLLRKHGLEEFCQSDHDEVPF